MPFKNPDLVGKILRAYRAAYIRDVALARTLDDSTFGALNTLIFQNYTEILQSIQTDKEFLTKLFGLLENGTDEEKSDVLLFLQEICSILKPFSKEIKVEFYKVLGQYGIYTMLEGEDLSVLALILENNPGPVRSEILKNHVMIDKLLSQFSIQQNDLGVLNQLVEVFKLLLDTTGSGSAVTTSIAFEGDLVKFLEYFYSECASKLFSVLLQDGSQKAGDNLLSSLCDLFSFITMHGMFCKNYLLHSNLLKQSSLLLKHPKSHVRLAVLRVFRVALGLNDEFYRRLLINQEVIGKILTCLLDTDGKNNLLNSACLEFFEYVRTVTQLVQ